MSAGLRIVRRRPPAAPVYLLKVCVARGGRTEAHGALWDGVLNATPEDDLDGPSPVEALLAAVAGCLVRNLRWVADGSRVAFERIDLRLAADRSDDPPAITAVRVEMDLVTDAPAGRLGGIVERALHTGTITRTLARAARVDIVVRHNGAALPIALPFGDA